MSLFTNLLCLFSRKWHPITHPVIDPAWWRGWDACEKLVPAQYLIYPYAMFQAVPDGDALYGVQLQGRWSERSLLDLRSNLARFVPERHLILPHSMGMATVLVYCGEDPRSLGATWTRQQAALRPAARLLAAVIRAALLNYPGHGAVPELRGEPVPGDAAVFARLVALVGRDTVYSNPVFGLDYRSALGNARRANYFGPEVADYGGDRFFPGGKQGWTKWRHGWGRDLTSEPYSHLRDSFVPPEKATAVVEALMRA